MAIDLTPEQRAVGEENFKKATEHLGLHRRDFLKAGILGAGALGGSAAAVWFGYQGMMGNPVRAALIGGGDEGGVLVGEHNPDFLKFVAVCDIRPSNMTRIFEGDPKVPLRKGFKKVYGSSCTVKGTPDYIEPYSDYDPFIRMLVERKDIEAVVIALPLHLHAKAAIDCMRAGKERGKPIHVLSEKLMGWNITQCKQMIKVAKETGSILSIGHQRHYSMVYAHALEVVKSGILGNIRHVRALWHRNFSWPWASTKDWTPPPEWMKNVPQPEIRDGWFPPLLKSDYEGLEKEAAAVGVSLTEYLKRCGYTGNTPEEAVAQLIRWRLYPETGGGLMAELGSHQLDAVSIFLGKVHPLAVQGYGAKLFFCPGRNDRTIDDHVFATYEFPGPNHPRGANRGTDKDDVVVMTYSSISTNGFEPYGECLMGTRGTMIVEAEQKVLLFTEKDPSKKGDARTMTVDVSTIKTGEAAAEASSTWGGPAASVTAGKGGPAVTGGPVSRGYREEMEDFAYCIRMWDPKVGYEKKDGRYVQRLPRCHGEVAMADAIVALSANLAMRSHQRLEFKDEWFDSSSKAVPDPDSKPKVPVEGVELG